MKKITGFISIVLLISIALTTVSFAAPTLEVSEFITKTWPDASVDCIITDFTEDYDPDFSLIIDNQEHIPIKTDRIENNGIPLNILFLVDISASMEKTFDTYKKYMSEIAGEFRSNDTFSMITFANEIKTEILFSDNPAEAGLKMGEQVARGSITKLYDALIEGNDLLKKNNKAGVIFLFSDGYDDGSIQADPPLIDFPVVPIVKPGRGINDDLLASLSKETDGFFMRNYNIEGIIPHIIKWKKISGTGYRVSFSGLPEFEPPVEKDIVLKAKIGNELDLQYTHKLVIEKPKSPIWLWILLIIAGIAIIALLVLRALRLRVPKGKIKKQKRVKGNIHYIAWLKIIGSDDDQLRIRKKVLTIGSNPESTIHLDDPTVSPLHAKITETTEGYVISDENSASGIFINEESIIGKQVLKNGDKIRVGKSVIEFTQSDFTYVSDRKVI